MSKKIKLIIFSIIVICVFLFFPNVVQARERSTELKIEANPIYSIPYTEKLGTLINARITAGNFWSAVADIADDSSRPGVVLNFNANFYCVQFGGNLNREETTIKAEFLGDGNIRYRKFIDYNNKGTRVRWWLVESDGAGLETIEGISEDDKEKLAYIGTKPKAVGTKAYPTAQQIIVWECPSVSDTKEHNLNKITSKVDGKSDVKREKEKMEREFEDYQQYLLYEDKTYFDYDTSKMTVKEDETYFTVGPITIDYFKYNRYTANDNNRLLYAGIGTSKITDYSYPSGDGEHKIYFKYDYSKNSTDDTNSDSFLVYDENGNEIPQNAWEFYYPNTRDFTKGDNEINHPAPLPGEEFYIRVLKSSGAKGVSKLKVTTFYTDISILYINMKNAEGMTDAQRVMEYISKIDYPTQEHEIPLEIKDPEPDPIIENKTEYGTISGYVWQDARTGKTYNFDGEMNITQAGDMILSGIQVSLYNSSSKLLESTTTNGDGYYEFDHIDEGNYYVEFAYDGLSYAPTTKNNSGTNTSKADETSQGRKTFNQQFATISEGFGQYKFTPGSEGTMAKSELIKGVENYRMTARTDEIQISSHTTTTTTEIPYRDENGEIVIGKEGNTIMQIIITNTKYVDSKENQNLGLVERFESDFMVSQDVYQAEVYHNEKAVGGTPITYNRREQNDIKDIEVNSSELIAYRNQNYTLDLGEIISNLEPEVDEEGNIIEKTKEELLAELEFYITYKIVVTNNSDQAIGKIEEILEIKESDFTLVNSWASRGTPRTTVQGNNVIITGLEGENLATGEGIEIFLRFRVDLTNGFEGTKEMSKMCTAEITKYSFYQSGKDEQYEKYVNGTVDKDSQPGNSVRGDYKTYEDDTDNAPSMTIKLIMNRKIAGTVWYDSNRNGIREEGEPPIKGVEVVLKMTNNTVVETVETGEDGKYVFENLEEGVYRIEFHYGHNKTTVETTGGKESYNGHEFETTVYTRNLLGNGSKAKDDEGRRNEVTENCKTINTQMSKLLRTPYENADDDNAMAEFINKTSMIAEREEDIPISELHMNATTANIGMGLRRREDTVINVEKSVSELKVLLTTGEVFTHATIENGNINYVGGSNEIIKPVLPSAINPNGSYEIELAEELTNGATLEIKYKFTITNNSNIGTVKITKLMDYLKDGMQMTNQTNNSWRVMTETEKNTYIDSEAVIENNVLIMTKELANTEIAPGQSREIYLDITIPLSSDNNDLNFLNTTEIIEYEISTGKMDMEARPGNNNAKKVLERDQDESEEVIVHGPTGQTRIYYVLFFSILAVLVGGIILIKKKVLAKK